MPDDNPEGGDSIIDDIPTEGEEDLDGEVKDKEKETPKAKDNSLATQKAKWRARAEKAEKTIKDLETKKKEEPGSLSEEDKKELNAQKYIKKIALEAVEEKEANATEADDKKAEQREAQLEEVLEDNPDITEAQVLDLIEDFAEDGVDLTPRQAIARLNKADEDKTKREKPKMPAPKRGDGDVKPKESEKVDTSNMSRQERMRKAGEDAKDALRKAFKK